MKIPPRPQQTIRTRPVETSWGGRLGYLPTAHRSVAHHREPILLPIGYHDYRVGFALSEVLNHVANHHRRRKTEPKGFFYCARDDGDVVRQHVHTRRTRAVEM